MSADPIHDALAHEPVIEPDPAFTATVMSAVRREADVPPIAFPWRRFAGGLAATIAAPVMASIAAPPLPDPSVAAPLGWVALALLGSWACYAISRRLTVF